MAAANDNRNARKRRATVNAARSLATMTRLIHELYGAEDGKPPNAEQVRGVNPQSMANS